MKEETLALAKLRLEEILTFFEVNPSVSVASDGDTLEMKVDADKTGRLIGHKGENLYALQQLMNAIVRAQSDERVFVNVDIADYKKERAEHLAEKVRADAQKVIETGEPRSLRPMTAAERRIVHMTLAEIPEVTTESEGEGPKRRVVIKPS